MSKEILKELISCKCGSTFAACQVEYIDQEWIEDRYKYLNEGNIVTRSTGNVDFSDCNCDQSENKKKELIEMLKEITCIECGAVHGYEEHDKMVDNLADIILEKSTTMINGGDYRCLVEVHTPSGNFIEQKIMSDIEYAKYAYSCFKEEYPKNKVTILKIPTS